METDFLYEFSILQVKKQKSIYTQSITGVNRKFTEGKKILLFYWIEIFGY